MGKKILVVGDWVIDEHWVASVHRSLTRSRAGRHHSRVLHELGSWILTLAGAGKTTEILHRAGSFDVTGVGEWHQKDDGALHRLLTESPSEFHHFNFATLSGGAEKLVNLGSEKSITTRVIRVWQQEGSHYAIEKRVDWEVEKKTEVCLDRLPAAGDFDAVVLKDMAKGVVTTPVVEKLQNRGAKQWFVSSKLWRPDWYGALAEKGEADKVKLCLVPPVAAEAALRKDVSRWFTDQDLISPEAVSALEKLRNDFPKAVICVLPKALSLIALVQVGEVDQLFTFLHEPKEQFQPEMPMASVFLPTMVAALLECWPEEKQKCIDRLGEVLCFVDNWMRHQFGRISSPVEWRANEEPFVQVGPKGIQATTNEAGYTLDVRIKSAQWTVASEEWREAHRCLGVIAKKRLETRRAAIEVDGYVCLVKQKRKVLRNLLTEIRSFDPDSGVSKSFMLLASPGTGKSYLVKKLADMENLELLPFNITSLHSRADLLDCFDTIVTSQAAKRERRFLVFFDEIDAHLDGQPSLSTTLFCARWKRVCTSVPARPSMSGHVYGCFAAPEAQSRSTCPRIRKDQGKAAILFRV
ncbi:MAG: AAA family ATPase [Acidobacteria bacterium]|nr:AAA family ATPase [Acidobacteriota bacterium]